MLDVLSSIEEEIAETPRNDSRVGAIAEVASVFRLPRENDVVKRAGHSRAGQRSGGPPNGDTSSPSRAWRNDLLRAELTRGLQHSENSHEWMFERSSVSAPGVEAKGCIKPASLDWKVWYRSAVIDPYQAGRSKHWIKVKNRKHPAMDRAAAVALEANAVAVKLDLVGPFRAGRHYLTEGQQAKIETKHGLKIGNSPANYETRKALLSL